MPTFDAILIGVIWGNCTSCKIKKELLEQYKMWIILFPQQICSTKLNRFPEPVI